MQPRNRHKFDIRWNEHLRVFHGKKRRLRKMVTGALAGAFLLAGILAVAGTVFFATTIKNLPDPNNLIIRQVQQSTKIYDRSGAHLLYEIHGAQKRTVVELDQIADTAKWAAISIEDKDFYKHRGFSIRSILRAVLVNILNRGAVQGGSTITQQLVKNAILTNERSFGRKIRELILSSEIERRFSKDQILKLYFNEIPYGSTSYGIESAAQTFFGKSAKDLDLPESALLAGLPKGPTYYSPYGTHRDELVGRWKHILDQMAEQKYVTQEAVDVAKKIDILKRVRAKRESINAPHFVFYVRELLSDTYGEQAVESGGLKVITTLDWEKQQAAEKAVDEGIAAVEKAGGSNAALVSLDPNTGEIVAMVGSRDYFNKEVDGAVNVTLRPRQPGSSFKPIVYLASFIKGYTPSTVLYDITTTFPTPQGPYEPKNYDLKERGPVTIRTALQGSLNIPAVKAIYLTGIGNVLDLADLMGYTTLRDRSRFGLSLVLGGGEVKLLEHTAAYGIFATEGVKHRTTAILKVEDAKGQVLEEWKKDAGVRVVDEEPTRNITNVLQDNAARAFIFGERNSLTLPDRQAAAKTGTTNDFRDGWTVGYVPQLAAGVWVGNNDNSPMKRGGANAAPIWNAYMREALKGTPAQNFTAPQAIITGKGILDGQTMPETKVTIDRISGKLATDFTPMTTREERVYREVHDTLHYVNKDDPRGAIPTDPAADPMYAPWEEAVARWATAQNIVAAKPPTEYDDVHKPEYRPTVSWVTPSDTSTVTSRTITLEANASAPRGVSRVEFGVDGQYLGKTTSLPYRLTVTLPGSLERGFHTFTATAFDDIDSSASASATVNVNADPTGPTVRWESPTNGAAIPSFPVPLAVTLNVGDVLEVKFYAQREGGAAVTLIGSTTPADSRAALPWQSRPTELGTYFLWPELVRTDGTTEAGERIQVLVQ